MTTAHPEYLVFRDTTGTVRKVETDPLSAVAMVRYQDKIKEDLRLLGVIPATPIFALLFGGKYERPRKESTIPPIPTGPTGNNAS